MAVYNVLDLCHPEWYENINFIVMIGNGVLDLCHPEWYENMVKKLQY